MDEPSTPLYPFGHGLSYAEFVYETIVLDRQSIRIGETATVAVEVRNAGDRPADEVVQLYTHQRHGSASRPVRELKAFERVHIPAAGSRVVTFQIGPPQLRYWSAATGGYVQDATTIDIWAGGSSEAELSATLDVRP
jgi:beta-glucosidase